MCGIVGYVGGGKAAQIVYDGLTALEYRGYDSAGISAMKGGVITTKKLSGRVCKLKEYLPDLQGNVAIGHTRWATHGAPTAVNAHPHTAGKFSVVHNGMISNYSTLKKRLESEGITFISQTDSEVIVWLLNYYYKGDLFSAVKTACGQLQGTYALAILCCDYDGVCAVKCKSSAIIGCGEGENYVASDLNAVKGLANKYFCMDDGDVGFLSADGVALYDVAGRRIDRTSLSCATGQGEDNLGNYPHYMLKEIAQTPSTITAAASNFCDNAKAGDIKNMVASAKGILLVGCGTAYNSGLVAQGWLKHRGIGCEVQVADQVTADDLRIWGSEGKLVFAISQSGETADTVEVARQLKEGGAKVVAITNVAYSALTRIADWVVDVSAGSEICVAATKSYAGQLACLYMLFGWAGEPNNLKSQLLSCAEGANKVFERRDELDTMARLCAGSGAVFFLGKGQDYAVATEGSLKLKEVSYIFSDAYPAGELKHGTLALIDGNTLSVIIICNKEGAEGCIAATEQILSRGGKTAVITSLPEVYERLKGVVEVFLLPPCPTHLTPFLSATALQLLAYKTALLKGTNPDKPRNLAKSVTV